MIIKSSNQENIKNRKNFIWNTIGVTVNSVNSLLFLIIVTRVNGLSDAGIFSLCFSTVLVFYSVALYGVRAYQVTDLIGQYSSSDYVASRMAASVLAIAIAVLFAILNRYDPYKFSVLLLLAVAKVLEAFSDVFYGILQKQERLDIAGKANFMKSVVGLGAFFLFLYLTHIMQIACAALIVINLGVLIFYELRWVIKVERFRFHFSAKHVWSIFVACFPVFSVSALSLYVLNVPRYAIDKVLDSASQGIYGIIAMPGTTISMLTALLIQFFLSFLAKRHTQKDKRGFHKIILMLVLAIAVITFFFGIFCYFFGVWLLKLLYGLDFGAYLPQLLWLIAGVAMLSISMVFCAALTTMRFTKIQFFIYLADTILAICTSTPLVRAWGVPGAAAAYDVLAAFQFIATGGAYLVAMKKSRNFRKECDGDAESLSHNSDL